MRILTGLLVLAATACFAQEITVRVINGKNGKTIQGGGVFVQFIDKASPSELLWFATDAQGEAHFTIPEPRPEHLHVHVVLKNFEHWHCGCWVMTDTETVVQKGIVDVPKNAKGSDMVAVKPKEIVVVARPLTFSERLLYQLMKD